MGPTPKPNIPDGRAGFNYVHIKEPSTKKGSSSKRPPASTLGSGVRGRTCSLVSTSKSTTISISQFGPPTLGLGVHYPPTPPKPVHATPLKGPMIPTAKAAFENLILDSGLIEKEEKPKSRKSESMEDTIKRIVEEGCTENHVTPSSTPTELPILPLNINTKRGPVQSMLGSKTQVATYAVTAKKNQNIPERETSIGTLIPYSFRRLPKDMEPPPEDAPPPSAFSKTTPQIVMDTTSITPTSYSLSTAPSAADKNGLTNVYVIKVNGQDYAVIRSGVVNTKDRADELMALIVKIRNEIAEKTGKEDFKIRVVSQQLNSFEEGKEAKMINNQHALMAYVNFHLEKDNIGEIVHFNTPSNAWVHYTKNWKILAKLLCKTKFFSGERLSKLQNLDALSCYPRWLSQDFHLKDDHFSASMLKIEICQKNINGKLQILAHAQEMLNRSKSGKASLSKAQVKYFEANIKEAKANLSKLRKEMKGHLTSYHASLTAYLKKTSPIDPKKIEFNEKATLIRKLLGSQLGIKGEELDRGQEGMTIQLLNSKFGVTSQINCKSGLDRTGLWHAIKLTLEKLLSNETNAKTAFNLVNNWAETNEMVNKKIRHLGIDNFNKWVNEPSNNSAENAEKERALKVLEFRKEVLNNLITIGLKVTEASTGVPGLKWNAENKFGMEENLIPLNFLPSHGNFVKHFVQIGSRKEEIFLLGDGRYRIGKNGQKINKETFDKMIKGDFSNITTDRSETKPSLSTETRTVQLVKYNRSGQPTGMTKEGQRLLSKFSTARGS